MPTYVYKFIDSGETIEIYQAFSDDALTEASHPSDGKPRPVKKVFTPVGVTFKGGGFYKNDSAANSKSGASSNSATSTSATASTSAGTSSSDGSSTSSGEKSASKGETKSETKTETKTETKSETKTSPAKSE
jgi:predicted nucleic acid-binding Zn ribbon protein